MKPQLMTTGFFIMNAIILLRRPWICDNPRRNGVGNMSSSLCLGIATVCVITCLIAPAASAQSATALSGVYSGTYTCAQGNTKLNLSLTASASGDVSALFTFYLPSGTQKQAYTYSLRG